jgi:hypothetical protein
LDVETLHCRGRKQLGLADSIGAIRVAAKTVVRVANAIVDEDYR